jgi:hypothetical protein
VVSPRVVGIATSKGVFLIAGESRLVITGFFRLVALVAVAALISTGIFTAPAHAHQARGSSAPEPQFEVTETVPVGSFGGQRYVRTVGWFSGTLKGVDGDTTGGGHAPGGHEYRVQFELIRPLRSTSSNQNTVVVEIENRGSPLMIQMLNSFDNVQGEVAGSPQQVQYPDGLGNGFVFDQGWSYARVQWQRGTDGSQIPSVPYAGRAIVRDFGASLGDGAHIGQSRVRYGKRLLVGWSQAATFINSYIDYGWNVGFRRARIYDGVLALSQSRNRMDDDTQVYMSSAPPLAANELLRRPDSDPVYVDAINYTDFYRFRSGAVRSAATPPYYRAYDLPSAHAPGFWVPDAFFDLCTEGAVTPLNDLDFRPYLRAMLVNLRGAVAQLTPNGSVGTTPQLPPSVTFELGPEPQTDPYFLGLEGTPSPVPLVDEYGQPVGGVRFPEVDLPLGRLKPVALPPVERCGTVGGYTPFEPAWVAKRYEDVDQYVSEYETRLWDLVAARFVLEDDVPGMLVEARRAYEGALNQPPDWENGQRRD